MDDDNDGRLTERLYGLSGVLLGAVLLYIGADLLSGGGLSRMLWGMAASAPELREAGE